MTVGQDACFETAKDAQLVELARQGDQPAFGELVRRHRQRCVDLARFFLRNRGDAEDQVQDAFMKAYEHLAQFHGDSEFFTWLARIVTNQCLMLMRLRRTARFSCLDEKPSGQDVMPIQLAAVGPDPEGELAFRELSAVLRFEVRRIPRLLRGVLLLHDIQGLPMMDVAAQLGITVAAAKSRLGRARHELRQRMTRHYEGIRDSSPLLRSAAPLNRVGRHCLMQAA